MGDQQDPTELQQLFDNQAEACHRRLHPTSDDTAVCVLQLFSDFKGTETSTLHRNCNHTTTTECAVYQLLLPLKRTVQASLKAYFEKETMSGIDSLACEICHGVTTGTTQLSLSTPLPRFLQARFCVQHTHVYRTTNTLC